MRAVVPTATANPNAQLGWRFTECACLCQVHHLWKLSEMKRLPLPCVGHSLFERPQIDARLRKKQPRLNIVRGRFDQSFEKLTLVACGPHVRALMLQVVGRTKKDERTNHLVFLFSLSLSLRDAAAAFEAASKWHCCPPNASRDKGYRVHTPPSGRGRGRGRRTTRQVDDHERDR